MNAKTPIFAKERSAAQLLDMTCAEFVDLVEGGHLPKPRNIAGHERWDVEELQRIINGNAVDGTGEIQW